MPKSTSSELKGHLGYLDEHISRSRICPNILKNQNGGRLYLKNIFLGFIYSWDFYEIDICFQSIPKLFYIIFKSSSHFVYLSILIKHINFVSIFYYVDTIYRHKLSLTSIRFFLAFLKATNTWLTLLIKLDALSLL